MSDDKKTINIMHISDIHCEIEKSGKPKYVHERKEVIEALYKYLGSIPDDWRPDIIAITGDLGWSGEEEDYEQFSRFLTRLLEELKLTTNDVICCPGNHDKHLSREQRFPKEITKTRDYYSVKCVYDHLEILVKDFTAYCNGLRQKKIPPLKNQSAIEDTKFLYGYRVNVINLSRKSVHPAIGIYGNMWFLSYVLSQKFLKLMTLDVNRYSLKNVADLLREGILNKDAFSTVFMILFLVLNVGIEGCWEIADELMVNIERNKCFDVAEWWKQVEENGETEGYLVHLMLVRHGKIKESSLGGIEFLLAKVREQYDNIPDNMKETLTSHDDLDED